MRRESISTARWDCVTAPKRSLCRKTDGIVPPLGALGLVKHGISIFGSVALALSVLLVTQTVSVSADPWKTEIEASLMLTQTSYSNNWEGGDAGSLAWTVNSNLVLQKQINPKVLSKNTVQLAFGQLHNQDKVTKHWDAPVKSTDLVDLESVLSLTLGGFVDPFVSGRLESQFYDNRDAKLERYLNPATFTETLGVTKILLREEKDEKDGRAWSLRLGGGFRQLMDKERLNPLTLLRGNFTANDGGIDFVSDLRYPLSEGKLEVTSRLDVFKAIFNSESDKLKGLPNQDFWKAPDIRWDNTITANITKYVMVNLYAQFLYDKEIDLGGRLKQTLSMGLTYKLR